MRPHGLFKDCLARSVDEALIGKDALITPALGTAPPLKPNECKHFTQNTSIQDPYSISTLLIITVLIFLLSRYVHDTRPPNLPHDSPF